VNPALIWSKYRGVFIAVVMIVATLATLISPTARADEPLLNASYDVAREFYRDYNQLFISYWKSKTGATVAINQSHAGSSQQTRAVIDGLAADVVTMNQGSDMQALAARGVIAHDWAQKFPHGAAPTYSTMLFVVRHGNPKHIVDWDDLAKPGISVVMVNPKTGGNGRYSYLAAWGYAKNHGASDADAEHFVAKILANVPVLDAGGRAATSTFVQRGIGDVLITFESEVEQIEKEFGAGQVDAIVPSISIRADNPVAVVDRTVDHDGKRELATAYLGYLYSEPAQEVAARHYLRVQNEVVMRRHADNFKPVKLFTVEDLFGGWDKAQKDHFADGASFDRAIASIAHR
jgi:sulfate transport system substrate-binding protein